ncbi:MAG: hypothetical protein M1825_000890 [Sarcosagium campestre]|nr:MAG: hypothetical protein M1825_000890 [Sarcosagium campestre]
MADECDLLDDSFEDIPAEYLNDLEEHALATQKNIPSTISTVQSGASNSLYVQGEQPFQTLPTLPSTSVHELRSRPQHVQYPGQRFEQAPQGAHRLSSDYDNFDDDGLDGYVFDAAAPSAVNHLATARVTREAAGEVTQREQWRVNRFADGRGKHSALPPDHRGTNGPDRTMERNPIPNIKEAHNGDDDDFKMEEEEHERSASDAATTLALKEKIEDLLRERDALKQGLEAASSTVESKAGEIAIVRANQAKAAKENERMITALKKLHADDIARQRADMDRTKAERERIATENRFLKRDLTEESQKARRLRKQPKESNPLDAGSTSGHANSMPNLQATPKRSKVLSYREGFDDCEILLSPSKLHVAKSKASTPKSGGKRKRRPTEDSPSQLLELSQPRRESTDDSQHRAVLLDAPSPQKLGGSDGRFEFFQSMLNHRPPAESSRAIELFAHFAFPSQPDVSFSAILLDKVALRSVKNPPENLPVDFCLSLLSLWSRCLKEEYHGPVSVLVELLIFALALDPLAYAPCIVDDILRYVQATAEINAIPRFQRKAASEINPDIDVHQCLVLVDLLAQGCLGNEADAQRFWRQLKWEFVLLNLNPVQPLDEIMTMLNILSTSVLKETFGPVIVNTQTDQQTEEKHVLERVTSLLIVTPESTEEGRSYSRLEVAEMRLEVLRLLGTISISPHGGEVMAGYSFVIGRLVRVMHDELDALYDCTDGHEQSAQQVNLATLLLFRLVVQQQHRANLQAALSTFPGGTHKYLIGLTRLVFSQDLVLEAGIQEQAIKCAHQMLEIVVTPEEGEALVSAFAGLVIATSGPSSSYPQLAYRNPLEDLVRYLDYKHKDNWAIWEFRAEGTGYPDEEVYGRIWHYPWPDHHPPPFAIIPNAMASMRNWLHDQKDRVVVVHCKAGKGRSGTMACSYLISECGWKRADALTRFTERRMRAGFGQGVSIPSQLRWVEYVDRWTQNGKAYIERPVHVLEVHFWGLKDGVKISVDGYVDEGKTIKSFHVFTDEERSIINEDNDDHDDDDNADVPSSAPKATALNKTNGSSTTDDTGATPSSASASATSVASAVTNIHTVFRPTTPIHIPTSDVNISLERRRRSGYGPTLTTSVAHVWFNAFFESQAQAQAQTGGENPSSHTFSIDWDELDGIKGSARKGTRCLEKLQVIYSTTGRGQEEREDQEEEQAGVVINEPAPGEEVKQTRPADWKDGAAGQGQGKDIGLRVDNPMSSKGGKEDTIGGVEHKKSADPQRAEILPLSDSLGRS